MGNSNQVAVPLAPRAIMRIDSYPTSCRSGGAVVQSSGKELLRQALEQLPEDASVEDAMERLVFLAKIERGLADAEAGRTLSHADVKKRLGL